MKNWISNNWVRPLTAIFVGAAITIVSLAASSTEASAQSKGSRIRQSIQRLKSSERRWIQVDLSQQRLVAWQGTTAIHGMRVSTGKKSTPTLTGIFNIQTKHRIARMRGEDYDIKDVPNVMYYDGGYGIHGAYWHNSFGTPVSRGCVNLRPSQARILYSWASVGTPVVIHR
ncbi:MAG: L,D-transpeptidase [Calothrix sp. C42_A2020_038]|nr:L,D-transpeptidase [Calothrix sp. C42_A2020_038]